ncbi:L-2-amino-thiazoline-4-carboxylic acid hydrolase, partial [bacterium]|nr:L-2-amino-thiazoline-4-carboxylic acid hydrolase [bacterium]
IEAMSRRVGLRHRCYARRLVRELGEERGRELIEQSIWDYGTEVGKATRRRVEELGLEPTPANMGRGSDLSPIGFDHRRVNVNGEFRIQSLNCVLADVWREYGEEELGQLYCLVDPAKMQAYSPELTLVHTKRIPLGDECCELAVRSVAAEHDRHAAREDKEETA